MSDFDKYIRNRLHDDDEDDDGSDNAQIGMNWEALAPRLDDFNRVRVIPWGKWVASAAAAMLVGFNLMQYQKNLVLEEKINVLSSNAPITQVDTQLIVNTITARDTVYLKETVTVVKEVVKEVNQDNQNWVTPTLANTPNNHSTNNVATVENKNISNNNNTTNTSLIDKNTTNTTNQQNILAVAPTVSLLKATTPLKSNNMADDLMADFHHVGGGYTRLPVIKVKHDFDWRKPSIALGITGLLGDTPTPEPNVNATYGKGFSVETMFGSQVGIAGFVDFNQTNFNYAEAPKGNKDKPMMRPPHLPIGVEKPDSMSGKEIRNIVGTFKQQNISLQLQYKYPTSGYVSPLFLVGHTWSRQPENKVTLEEKDKNTGNIEQKTLVAEANTNNQLWYLGAGAEVKYRRWTLGLTATYTKDFSEKDRYRYPNAFALRAGVNYRIF